MTMFGRSPNTSYDIWLMSVDSGRPVSNTLRLFRGTSFGESLGQISPDGHWMLFTSDLSGRYEIYVTSYPQPGPIHQVSRSGGTDPLWNPSAPEIAYMDGRGIYTVDVVLAPEFHADEPRLLFEGLFADIPGLGYDIAPDGQHFLMLQSKDLLTPVTTLTVITNIIGELRDRH